jgi:hypothetical protein
VGAKLRISRLSRPVGWGCYKIVLDGGEVGTLVRGKSAELEVAPGTHTLQLEYRFGLGSAAETFSVFAGETAAFVCYPPSFAAILPRMVGVMALQRGFWITLDRARHEGGDGSSPSGRSDQHDLARSIQAGRTNVRW